MKTRKIWIGVLLCYLIGAMSSGIGGGMVILLMQFTPIPEPLCNLIWGALYALSCYFGSKLLIEKYFKGDLKDYIGKFKIDIKWLIVGILLPLCVVGTFFLFQGNLVKSNMSQNDILNNLSLALFVQVIATSIVEEMIFRGLMMNILRKKYSIIISIVVSGIIFALVHVISYNVTGFIDVFILLISGTLMSVVFALISLKSKSIWNNALAHGLWNLFIIGGILNIGNTLNEDFIYTYVLKSNSVLLTGGQFGIEASLIANIGYILVSLYVYYLIKKEKSLS